MSDPIILNGKAYADEICADLKKRVDNLHNYNIKPELIIVTASTDPASKIYVHNKIKRCNEIGIKIEHIVIDNLTEETMEYVGKRNVPCIVQMPFHSDKLKVDNLGDYITAENDVDGFVNWDNIARLAMGKKPMNFPCTPLGVMKILKKHEIKIRGVNACIIGRSNIVGRPLARMLEHEGATVTLCHSLTDPYEVYKAIDEASIVVSATGCLNVINMADMLRYVTPTCKTYSGILDGKHELTDVFWYKTFVDVGMNRNADGKLVGDIDPEIFKHCHAYTPVPGGIGPLTVASLCSNVVERYEKNCGGVF